MALKYPPKIDATTEQIAHAVLNNGGPKGPVQTRDYRRVHCVREVSYPETLFNDGRCEECHRAAV